GILVVIAVAVWSPWKSVHGPDVYRIGDTQTMVLLAPSEVSFSEDSVFRWNRLTGAGYYIFELLDKELTPVWKSDVLKSPRFHLLLEIAQKLTVEETYFWKITAFTDEGLKMNSGIKSFKFKGMKRDVQEIPAF
ncbi:MAG: hypothetical protein KAX11_06030, partial [Candidatus Aminicenantes bacterium]|nr:hypothetical protein [Candidatus Aminicenantes bacterium]